MDIDADDDILRRVAKDASMDYSIWPALVPDIVSRIEKIAHTEFLVPNLPPPQPPVRPPSPRLLAPLPSSDPIEPPDASDTAPSSQETNKENANPSSPTAQASTSNPPSSSQPPSAPPPLTILQPPIEPGGLPSPFAALLNEITSVLTANFMTYPPHTVQRLSELILSPRRHYRSLSAYLHALDRVVHVTSGANLYPLAPAVPDISSMSMLANGVGSHGAGLRIDAAAANSSVGSDEALGGALLTPIPWLTRRTNGGDGAGSDESDGSPTTSNAASAVQNGQHQNGRPQPQAQGNGAGRSANRQQPLEGQVRTEHTETIQGPNGVGRIETVSVSVNGIPSHGAATAAAAAAALAQRGVTQGELLRQEQRAGVVPVSQLARHAAAAAAAAAATHDDDEEDEEGDADAAMGDPLAEADVPHARGPEEIGAADTGPQSRESGTLFVGVAGGGQQVEMHGIDVEAAVGRKADHSSHPHHAHPHAPAADSAEKADAVSRSPKREAEDALDEGGAKKKPREKAGDDDGDAGAAADADTGEGGKGDVQPATEEAGAKGKEPEVKKKK